MAAIAMVMHPRDCTLLFLHSPPALKEGEVSQIDKQMVIDDHTKQSTQEILFDFIAKSVAEFVEEHKITSKLPLGFTFSFPVHQTSLISGTLIRWTKDFSATGAVGEDVVKLLRDAFVRRGVSLRPFILGGQRSELSPRTKESAY